MNRDKKQFPNLDLPKVQQMSGHKRRLRAALLSAHRERSGFSRFGFVVNDIIKTMTTPQKSLALSSFALTIIVGAAGVFGPSAYTVAHAEAKESVNRAFVHLAQLSDEERAEFSETHGLNLTTKDEGNSEKLAEILAEAKEADDLQIVSADELPIPGFIGRAGRTFGFKMMYKLGDHEERLSLLPEEVRKSFIRKTPTDGKSTDRHNLEGLAYGETMDHTNGTNEQTMPVEFDERNIPATFMVFTNSEGYKVYLGLNANDEPISVLTTNGDLPTKNDV